MLASAPKGVLGWLSYLLGSEPAPGDIIVFFNARLDETGTDGRSPYVIVGGAVSTAEYWSKLERRWSHLLVSRGVKAFHTKEFTHGQGDFDGWGELKRANFVRAQERIILRNTLFQIVVAVEKKTHAAIKKEWTGIKGFKRDSDPGICFRVARFLICQKLAELFSPDVKVSFLVESGPYAADMGVIYEDVRKTQNATFRPALHAKMLNGFAHAPKGLKSLEAADYISGRALADLEAGRFLGTHRREQIAQLLDPDFLNQWNAGMAKERERRREYAANRRALREASPE